MSYDRGGRPNIVVSIGGRYGKASSGGPMEKPEYLGPKLDAYAGIEFSGTTLELRAYSDEYCSYEAWLAAIKKHEVVECRYEMIKLLRTMADMIERTTEIENDNDTRN